MIVMILSALILSSIHLQKKRSRFLRSEDCKVYLSGSTCKFNILYVKSKLKAARICNRHAGQAQWDRHSGTGTVASWLLRPNSVQVRALAGDIGLSS